MNFDSNSLWLTFSSIVSRFSSFGANFAYTKYVFIGLFIFLIFFVLGKERHFAFHHHEKGAIFGILVGVILMLILDAIVIFGAADKDKIKKLFTQKDNRQEVAGEIMSSGLNNLNQVLGIDSVSFQKKAKNAAEVVSGYLTLPPDESKKVRDLICK